MQILRIRLKNLNSLRGEWSIDLTDPAYQNAGIFAITGPTGAGKSTLFDAICLALFGQTPRLDNISKTTNEIMTSKTGECFAEVDYQSVSGQYRAHWGQRRARSNPDGELQQPKREFMDLEADKILATKKNEVVKWVEDTTGMNFDRFTRSMVLAQGKFAAFLQANSNQRSPILEQITGQTIYSDISVRIHERKNLEQKKYDELLSESKEIKPLSEEEVQTYTAELAALRATLSPLDQQIDKVQADLNWYAKNHELNHDLAQTHERADIIKEQIQTFAPEQNRLERATKAHNLRAEFQAVSASRKQVQQATTEQEKIEKALPSQKQTAIDAETARQFAEESCKEQEDAITQRQSVWRDVHALNQSLSGLDRQITPLKTSEQSLLKSIQDLLPTGERAAINDLSSALQGLETQRDQIAQQVIAANSTYETATKQVQECKQVLATLSATMNLSDLKRQKEAVAQEKDQLLKTQNILSEMARLQESKAQQTADIAKIEETLNRLQKEAEQLETHGNTARNNRDNLVKLLRQEEKIKSLEEERQKLIADHPCPLCGSRDHPLAGTEPPDLSETEAKLHDAETLYKQLQDRWADNFGEIKSKQSEKETIEKQALGTQARMEELFDALPSPAHADWRVEDCDLALSQLKTRQETIDQNITRLEEATNALQQAELKESRANDQRGQLEARQDRLADLSEQAHKLNGDLTSLFAEQEKLFEKRRALIGDSTVEAEEQAFHAELKTRKALLEGRRQEQLDAKTLWEQNTSRLADLRERLIHLQQAQIEKTQVLTSALKTNGFADEADYLSACLPDEQRETLMRQANSLQEQNVRISNRLEELNQKLQDHLAGKEGHDEQAVLEVNIQEYKAKKEALLEQIGAVDEKLRQDETLRQRQADKLLLIDQQKKTLDRWQLLWKLIGSSDGTKYRNFAQGLTFEIMISYANQQLARMNDRYILVRNAQHPLELDIVDTYQGDEVRSTKNLSGGESFIVSLALGLGLSQMSSNRVRVDSLFLDEGFGTLDEDVLETALTALSSLHQEGKLIGVISHVASLKERIGTQIQITKHRNGTSTLHGPGITRSKTALE